MNDVIACPVVRLSRELEYIQAFNTRLPTPFSILATMKLTATALVASLGLLATATPVSRRAVGDPMCGGT
jgi:hypothetical protein